MCNNTNPSTFRSPAPRDWGVTGIRYTKNRSINRCGAPSHM
jgi:hypothetical protein